MRLYNNLLSISIKKKKILLKNKLKSLKTNKKHNKYYIGNLIIST